jgi:ketosteroid isomerase-like protein
MPFACPPFEGTPVPGQSIDEAEPTGKQLPAVDDMAGASALLRRFSLAVDSRLPALVARFFTEDALFRPGEREVRGRAAIESFYLARLSDPRRTTRHVWSNVELRPSGDGDVLITALLTNYAFEPDVSETALQMRLGDVECRCVRGANGEWQFATHLYTRVFTASLPLAAPPPSPPEGSR